MLPIRSIVILDFGFAKFLVQDEERDGAQLTAVLYVSSTWHFLYSTSNIRGAAFLARTRKAGRVAEGRIWSQRQAG